MECLEVLGKLNSNNIESYGFKPVKCTRNDRFWTLFIANDKKRNTKHNSFQAKLKNDIEHVKISNKIFVFTPKSRNMYEVKQEEYKNLLKETITKNSNKSSLIKVYNINESAKKVIEKLLLLDRIEKMQEPEAYITIKDHKQSFPNKIPCLLINPSRNVRYSHQHTALEVAFLIARIHLHILINITLYSSSFLIRFSQKRK